MGKTRPKNSTIIPHSTLSVLCMKIQGPRPPMPTHTAKNARCPLIAV